MLDDEKLITFNEATAILPHRPHVNTLWRWARRGVSGVHLEYMKAGKVPLTSREALHRFMASVRDAQQELPQTGRTAAERDAAIAAAEKATADL